MSESASTHDPYDVSKKLTHLTHWPIDPLFTLHCRQHRVITVLGGVLPKRHLPFQSYDLLPLHLVRFYY